MFEKDPNRFLRDKSDPESLANKKTVKGETPLYYACKNGNLDVLQLLLEQKANPHELSHVNYKLF